MIPGGTPPTPKPCPFDSPSSEALPTPEPNPGGI